MGVAYKCDRCKQFFDGAPKGEVSTQEHTFADRDVYQLCATCFAQSVRFITESPAKAATK